MPPRNSAKTKPIGFKTAKKFVAPTLLAAAEEVID